MTPPDTAKDLPSQLELAARIVRENLPWEFKSCDHWDSRTSTTSPVERVYYGCEIRLKPQPVPTPAQGEKWGHVGAVQIEMPATVPSHLVSALIRAIEDVQDWGRTRVGDALDALDPIKLWNPTPHPADPTPETQAWRPKVGERVKVKKTNCILTGEAITITEIDPTHSHPYHSDKGLWFRADQLEPHPEPVAQLSGVFLSDEMNEAAIRDGVACGAFTQKEADELLHRALPAQQPEKVALTAGEAARSAYTDFGFGGTFPDSMWERVAQAAIAWHTAHQPSGTEVATQRQCVDAFAEGYNKGGMMESDKMEKGIAAVRDACLKAVALEVHGRTCVHHNDAQRASAGCPACETRRRNEAETELHSVHLLLDNDPSKIIRDAKDGYPGGRESRILTLTERVKALARYAADWKQWKEEAEAKLREVESEYHGICRLNIATIKHVSAQLAAEQQAHEGTKRERDEATEEMAGISEALDQAHAPVISDSEPYGHALGSIRRIQWLHTERGLSDARLKALQRVWHEKFEAANKMRGEALLALVTMQNERDAYAAHIARESRISDSEMMALLRRRANLVDELEKQLAQEKKSFASMDMLYKDAEKDCSKARNELYEAEKRLEQLAAQSGWIPCSQRMPTKEDASTLGTGKHGIPWGGPCVLWVDERDNTYSMGVYDGAAGSTHWMPIPPLPADAKDGEPLEVRAHKAMLWLWSDQVGDMSTKEAREHIAKTWGEDANEFLKNLGKH